MRGRFEYGKFQLRRGTHFGLECFPVNFNLVMEKPQRTPMHAGQQNGRLDSKNTRAKGCILGQKKSSSFAYLLLASKLSAIIQKIDPLGHSAEGIDNSSLTCFESKKSKSTLGAKMKGIKNNYIFLIYMIFNIMLGE